MSSSGLILVGITLFITISFFVCYPWTRKVFDSYWFYLTIGIIGLVYFVAGRWGFDIANLIQAGGLQGVLNSPSNHLGMQVNNDLDYESSILVSKAFLLDMCPFMCLCLAITFIADPKRKALKVIAPWAIFGGTITLFGGVLFEAIPANMSYAEYIFVGQTDPNNRLYFIMHFYLFVFGIIGLVASQRLSLNDFLYSCIYASLYLIYVKVMVDQTHCAWNATGMVANDWLNGEYKAVYDVLQLGFPAIQAVGYLAVFLVIIIFVLLKTWICYDPYKKIHIIDRIYIKWFPSLSIYAAHADLKWALFQTKVKKAFTPHHKQA